MATGKSRVGAEFARLIQWPFVDADQRIEQIAGEPIASIFELYGEDHFREIESQVVRELCARTGHVVAWGGGAVVPEGNWALISASGLTVRLTANTDLLIERIRRNRDRPLLAQRDEREVRARLNALLREREPFYSRAQYTFESRDEVPARRLACRIYRKLLESS